MEAATFSYKKKPPSFPKHPTNNAGPGYFPTRATTSYDDVFGGPPMSSSSLAPRAEDYPEIFGGFRTTLSSRASCSSSIPVLDLPPVNSADFDSVFDYSDVFGGFNAVDFAVPFFELFPPSSDGCHVDVSSDEAWTPVGTESLSDDSDPFAFSEKSQCFSNGDLQQPVETKQFNVSYHQVNSGTNTCMPNMMHVAQLHDVPGYTCVVNGATSVREIGKESFFSPVVDDIAVNMDVPPVLSQKHTRKTVSHLSNDDGAGMKSFDTDRRSGRARSASISHVNSAFASVSDIDASMEPSHLPPLSRPPPLLAERNGHHRGWTSGPIPSKQYAVEATVDSTLPPFFDMEVDASSSAAASAAAMKDAMDKAQAKLKAAKEFRIKKDSFQSSGQLGLKTDVNGGEDIEMAFNERVSEERKTHKAPDRGTSKIKSSAKARHARNASQILPDIPAVEQPTVVTGQPVGTKHAKKCSISVDTASVEVAGEWKEAKQYYEFVNSDNSRLAPLLSSNGDGKKATIKQQDNGDNNSDSAGEACLPEENRPRLKATKAVSRQQYYKKMVKVAQDVHETLIGGQAETDKGLKDMYQVNKKEQKPKLVFEPEQNEGWEAQGAEGDLAEDIEKKVEKTKDVLDNDETGKDETEASHREEYGRKANGPNQSMVKEAPKIKDREAKVRGLRDKEEIAQRAQEALVMEGNHQRLKEANERLRGEGELAETIKEKKSKERSEVKDKRSKGASKDVFGGERAQPAYEGQENDKMKDLEHTKVSGNGLNNASKDVAGGERLQSTCESDENDNTGDLLQRHEYEAIDGRGSERMLDQYVDLDKYWESMEVLEQEKTMQGLSESSMPVVDNKMSENCLKQDGNREQIEMAAEQDTVLSKSMHADELEESRKIHDNTGDKEVQNTGDKEVQNGECSSHIQNEWESEDQEPDSLQDIELPMEERSLKFSKGANLSRKEIELDTLSCGFDLPQRTVNGYQEVSAQEENGDVGMTPVDEESDFEAVEPTDVVIDERKIELTAAQVTLSDNELERGAVHNSDILNTNEKNTKSGGVCTKNVQNLKEENKKVVQSVPGSKLVKESNHERGGNIRNLGEGHNFVDQEERVRSVQAEEVNGWNGHLSKKEAAHSLLPDRKETIPKRSQLPKLVQSLEEIDEKEKRDLEKEHLRKLEEEREREREREKDRMAVEVAIREARERAYADARDRAERVALERATDDARQRAMAEARERLEKACAEARERSSADKSSEARLRAERAAVERATVEARQRAIEKAMTERATFEARERMQRSVSEKYTTERDVIMRQSSFPSTSERFEAANGEPAERCKARLERHRRTVERVAKALAEKNTRDLLAQKEQAERSRLAETLDADIKRWSGGKAGNLRALLSTLQYILGPDSGWQPIPLTEVITAAAVKKAYRKATLCVHPDKLQQRGATIQQKYICEKVFDLLKEAWNRFNSEEK